MKKTLLIKKLAFFVIVFMNFFCRSPGEVKEHPAHGGPTEFHREAAKFIPYGFLNITRRGVDDRNHIPWYRSLGFGLGLFIHQDMSWMWTGHKFLYYYIDLDYSQETVPQGVYPYSRKGVISTYPGIYIRTYLPWIFKIHYGAGINLRLSETLYDRWGLYGKAGLELYGFTISTLVIGHPGQSNWEREYRIGYLYAPIRW